MKEEYAKYSPVNYANKIDVPVLLIHGKADFRVDDAQSRLLHKAIEASGGESEIMIDSWGRHGFLDEDRRVAYYNRVFSFLEEHSR